MSGHIPVMLDEVIAALEPRANEVYLDATYGGGGYSRAILSAAPCQVIGMDRDPDALKRARAHAREEPRLLPLEGRFGDLDTAVKAVGFDRLDGVILDLGVSSYQLDEAMRGLSFQRQGPLDMRMEASGPSAADIVNTAAEKDLANIFYHLGEEKASRRIARAIVERRVDQPFTQTLDLAALIERVTGPRRGAKRHPATRTFQALRLYINDELGELGRALSAAERILKAGGRLIIVSFHSLEDRIVKRFLAERSARNTGGSRHAPAREAGPEPSFELIQRKAVAVSHAETQDNRRARSSRLRAAIRTEAPSWNAPAWTGVRLPDLILSGAAL